MKIFHCERVGTLTELCILFRKSCKWSLVFNKYIFFSAIVVGSVFFSTTKVSWHKMYRNRIILMYNYFYDLTSNAFSNCGHCVSALKKTKYLLFEGIMVGAGARVKARDREREKNMTKKYAAKDKAKVSKFKWFPTHFSSINPKDLLMRPNEMR